jgi:hypothetical protein
MNSSCAFVSLIPTVCIPRTTSLLYADCKAIRSNGNLMYSTETPTLLRAFTISAWFESVRAACLKQILLFRARQ